MFISLHAWEISRILHSSRVTRHGGFIIVKLWSLIYIILGTLDKPLLPNVLAHPTCKMVIKPLQLHDYTYLSL